MVSAASTAPSLAVALAARRRAAAGDQGARHRDPRAVSRLMRTNMTVPESCAFYGIADSLTGCRVPRSCQDCLAMPGCRFHTPSGRCIAATDDHLEASDYHRILAPGQSYYATDKSLTFFAENSTYCAASDRVCAACREDFRALDRNATYKFGRPQTSFDSAAGGHFCVGEGDCVCVGICELPEKRAAYAYDWNCHQPVPHVPRTDRYLPIVSSMKRDPRAPQPNLYQRLPPVTECRYEGPLDLQGRQKERSCRSCFSVPDCTMQGGSCYSTYDHEDDYRVLGTKVYSGGVSWTQRYIVAAQFPTSNTSICSRERCEGCSSAALNWSSCIDEQLSCVCPEVCDTLESRSPTTHIDWFHPVPVVVLIFMALAFGVIWYLDAHPRTQAHTTRRARQDRHLMRNMLDRLPAVARLDLFGWRDYQRRLRQKEEELLGGAESVSPVYRVMDFDSTSPSAPDFDDDEMSSAPTMVDLRALASAPVFGLPEETTREEVATLTRRGRGRTEEQA